MQNSRPDEGAWPSASSDTEWRALVTYGRSRLSPPTARPLGHGTGRPIGAVPGQRIERFAQRPAAVARQDLILVRPPAGLPEIAWRGADTISRKWRWYVENLGSQRTIEKVLIGHASHEAVIEWTHWMRKTGTAQRGDEWYVFDEATGLIREIHAYYASPAVRDTAELPLVGSTHMGELVEFDYAGRGHHLNWNPS